jgi:hypothetical protein
VAHAATDVVHLSADLPHLRTAMQHKKRMHLQAVEVLYVW